MRVTVKYRIKARKNWTGSDYDFVVTTSTKNIIVFTRKVKKLVRSRNGERLVKRFIF